MFNNISEKMSSLLGHGETFALAQVVWRQAPSSGKPGDKAIIRNDGSVIGWIGGGCVKGIVIKEGMEAIKDHKYRLVKISPDYKGKEETDDENIKKYKMTCHSGGSMEVFIEPVIPNPHLIIMGRSNIAKALAKVAKAADFKVSVHSKVEQEKEFEGVDAYYQTISLDDHIITPNTFVVVSTQGDTDEWCVKNALLTGSSYVGFIASKRKSKQVKDYLGMEKLDDKLISSLRTPVGLDINAKLPSEVAVSIVADIVKEFRSDEPKEQVQITMDSESVEEVKKQPEVSSKDPEFIVNPVCNLPITKESAKYVVREKGELIYFCCDGCKVSFDKNPDTYIMKMRENQNQ